jgi:MscS family membrane protein
MGTLLQAQHTTPAHKARPSPIPAAPAGAPAAMAPAVATPSAPDLLGRASPQSAMLGFFEACRAGNYSKALRFLDLRDKTPAERANIGPGLARQLQDVLDRSSDFDLNQLSNDPSGDLSDGLSPDIETLETYTIDKTVLTLELHRIRARSGNLIWLVTPESLTRLAELHTALVESSFEKRLPAFLVSVKFLDTALWQWTAYVLLAGLLLALSRLLSRAVLAGVNMLLSLLSRDKQDVLTEFARPIWLLLSITVFRAAVEAIGGSVLVRLGITRLLAFLFFLAVAWLAADFVDVIAVRVKERLSPRQRAVSASVIPLFQRVAKIALFSVALLVTLSNWGYNTNAILAGLGVGGLAVALAAQKTLENLFGGLSVITDRPVLVGDFCKFGAQTGTVEEIGLRSTRIRTQDRTLVSVPNSQFSTMTLENFAARDRFWFHPTLNLRGDATIAQIRAVIEDLEDLLRRHPKVDAGRLPVRFTSIGTYAFAVEIFAYVQTIDGDEFNFIQTDLLMKILEIVEAAGTGLAVPVQESLSPPMPQTAAPAQLPAQDKAGSNSGRID